MSTVKIDYEKYKAKKQTLSTLRYDNPEVDKVEISNVFYKAIRIKEVGKTKDGVKLIILSKPVNLTFNRTGKSGHKLGIPTLSSLRSNTLDFEGTDKYPFKDILINLDSKGLNEYKQYDCMKGIRLIVDTNIKSNSDEISKVKLALRSNEKSYGHCNEFQLQSITVGEEWIRREIVVPINKEGRALGVKEVMYKDDLKLEWDKSTLIKDTEMTFGK